jgi:hypothetical protein
MSDGGSVLVPVAWAIFEVESRREAERFLDEGIASGLPAFAVMEALVSSGKARLSSEVETSVLRHEVAIHDCLAHEGRPHA